ncbi:Transcription elongation factor spt6, partial [Linnemannia schmuckeri]
MSEQTEKYQRRSHRRLLADEEDDEEGIEQLHKQNYNHQPTTSRYDSNDAFKEKDLPKVVQESVVDKEEGSEDEDGPQASRKSRKRKEVLDEDLDEDDLALVEENTGMKIQRPEKFKRLKKRHQDFGSGDDNSDENRLEQEPSQSNFDPLARLFDDPVDDGGDNDRGRGRESEDDMDFIVEEESEGNDDRDIIEHERKKRQQQAAARNTVPLRASIRNYNEEMNEWHGVFGDGEDYAYALSKENGEIPFNDPPPKAHLKDVFEPGVLAEKMLTHSDDILRLKDVPERMQMRPGIKTDRKLTDLEIELETYWVTTALNDNPRRIDRPSFDSIHVQAVLKFMSQELLEVPFIGLHRQDYFTSVHGHKLIRLLSRDDLWFIYDEDFKFRSFLERKEAIGALVDRMHIKDEYLNYSLLRAERLEELTDISDYINLRYSKKVDESNTSLLRRPGSAGVFDPQEREHLSTFITTLGMTTREFGTNLSEGIKKFFPKDDKAFPEKAAEAYVKAGISSPQKVISMAVEMMTQEVTVDPLVRRAIRTKYETASCVTVTPTEKGVSMIDELHPYYPFKRMTQKNVREFHDGQFLQILQAQSEGLLKIEIKIPDEDKYVQGISGYYLSNGCGDKSQQWNALRTKILFSALKTHIFVAVERGMIEKLRVQAEEWVGLKCQVALEERMTIAPFMVPGTTEGKEVLPRVVAISHGPGSVKDAIQVVYVDNKGQFIELDNLRDRAPQEELLDLLERQQPDVVVVGGFSVATRRLLEQTESVVREHRDSNGDQVSVIMTNDEIAKLYQSSKRGIEDHPKAYEITRYCISLARTIQNPINEYVGTGADLVGIRLHPLQEFVGASRLRELLDRALVNVVNDVGVDINEVVSSPYKALMLPYICGLGTRKAQHLIRTIERDPVTRGVDKRSDLVNRKILTWNIFMNCCSFLRVHTERGGDILDQTRIHFEDYNLARKMAADALEIDEEGLRQYDEESQHVEELMRDNNAERLNELLLEDYARQLQKMQRKPKRMTLEHIKAELQHPFRDHRTRFVPATSDQIFTMLTGETEQTLKEGFIVPALVTKVREKNAMCRLDCGIDGILSIQNISDSRIGSVKDHVSEGQTLQVKILRLEKDRFFADLTCKESELRQGDAHLRALPVDRTFDQFEEDRFKDPADSNDRQGGFVHRKIHHPLFKNITSEAAIKYLSTKNRGELVVRPSHRGAHHLVITVKIADDIYKHYDVLDKGDDVSLGKVLQIDESTYNNLDELLVSHIEAILGRIHTLMSSPKYRENEYELRTWLETQTRSRPDVAVYGFTLSRKYPGYFSLIFKLGYHAKIDEWNIKVLPQCYQLKGPSKRDCVDPTAISDNFKDMASKLSHRRAAKKSGNPSGPGYGSGSAPSFDSSAHRNRSQSRHRNSVSSNTTSFSTNAKPMPSNGGYSPPYNTNAHSTAYDRSRSRPRYQNGDGSADNDFQDTSFDGFSSQDCNFPSFQSAARTNTNTSWNDRGRSRPRHGYSDSNGDINSNNSWNNRAKSRLRQRYGDSNANTGGHIGTCTNNIPVGSRSKSKARYGDGDADNGNNSTWNDRKRSSHRNGDNDTADGSNAARNNRGRLSYRNGGSDANNDGNAAWGNRGRSRYRSNEKNAADNRGRSTYRDRDNKADHSGNGAWNSRGRSSYRSGDSNAAVNRGRSSYRNRDDIADSNNDGAWGNRGRSSYRNGDGNADDSDDAAWSNQGRPNYRGRDNNGDNNSDTSWNNRGRSRYRGRDSNADSNTNNSWNDRTKSKPRYGYSDNGSNIGSQIGTGTNNISVESRSKSKARYGADDSLGSSFPTTYSTGSGSSYHRRDTQDSSRPSYKPFAATSSQHQPMDSTAYSPEPMGSVGAMKPVADLNFPQPRDFAAYSPGPAGSAASAVQPSDRREMDQSMDFTAYSPEPTKPPEPMNSMIPSSARSASSQPANFKACSPETEKPAEYVRFLRAGRVVSQPIDFKAYSPEPMKPEEASKLTAAITAMSGSSQPTAISDSSQLTDFTAYFPEPTQLTESTKPKESAKLTPKSVANPAANSESSQAMSTLAYSPELKGRASSLDRTDSSQPMDFTAYSPEPMALTDPPRTVTEAYKSWNSSSSATTGGGDCADEDDMGTISWGSGSYGGGNGDGGYGGCGNKSYGGGNGGRSYGIGGGRSYGSERQDEGRSRFGDNGRSGNSSDRRPYQSQPPQQRQQSRSSYGGYGAKGQDRFLDD